MVGRKKTTKANECSKGSPSKALNDLEDSPVIGSRRKRQVSKRMQEWIDDRQSKKRHSTKAASATKSSTAAAESPAAVVEETKRKTVKSTKKSKQCCITGESVSAPVTTYAVSADNTLALSLHGDMLVEEVAHESAETAVIEPSEAAVIGSSQAAVIEPSEAAVIEPSEAAVIEPSEAAVIEPSEAAVIESSQAVVIEPPQAAVIEPSEAAVIEPSQAAVIESSQAAVIESSQSVVIESADLMEEPSSVSNQLSAVDMEVFYHPVSSDGDVIGVESEDPSPCVQSGESTANVVDGFQTVMGYQMSVHDNSVEHSNVLDQTVDQSEAMLHIIPKSESVMQIPDNSHSSQQTTDQAETNNSPHSQSEMLTHLTDQSQTLESLTSGPSQELDQSSSIHPLNSQSYSVVEVTDQSHSMQDMVNTESTVPETLQHGTETAGELSVEGVQPVADNQGDVQIMLSSNDSVTQALLESFMADNCTEQEMIKASDVDMVEEDLPTEHHIAPNIKLTETIQVDENGKKHTVVYLSTGNMDGSEQMINEQQRSVLTDRKTSLQADQLSTQMGTTQILSNSNTKESKSQEVVIEVYVGSEQHEGGKKIQNVRVVNPNELSSSLQNRGSSQLLATSLQTATGLELYSCNKCDYTADKKYNLQKHIKVHHDDKPHLCPLPDCGYSARTFSNLKRHQLTHTDERKYPCPQCSLRFKQKIHLDKHINYIHREKSIKCDFCEYVCSNRIPDLKLHMKRRHLKNDVDDPPTYLECEKCGFLAASRKDLKQHFKFHRRGPELKLFCEHCSFVTDAKSRLQRHRMIHTKEKPFSCSLCDYRASQKEHIRRHHRTRHKDVAFEVEEGEEREDEGAVFNTIDRVTSPAMDDAPIMNDPQFSEVTSPDNKKSAIKEYPMDEVAVGSTSDVVTDVGSDVMDAASTTAANGTPSNADLTPVVTTSPAEKKSIKYEPPDYSQRAKSFGCTHCTMRFVRLLSLYKHLHTQHSDLLPHTVEEKLTCVVCEFRAQSHKALLVHMRKHNSQEAGEEDDPGSLYVCVLCKYMNNKRRNLYQHLKKKHKISMMVRKDGTVSCVVEPNAEVTVVSSSPGQQVTEVVKVSSENEVSAVESQKIVNLLGTESNRVVNLLDLANSLTHKHDISHLIQKVNIESGESEQAAAEAIVDLATQSVVIEEEVTSPLSAAAILEADESGAGQIHISEQQLHSLSSGDFIEIDGQTYKVETRGDSITAVLYEPEQAPVATSSYLSNTDTRAETSPYGLTGEVVVTMSDMTGS